MQISPYDWSTQISSIGAVNGMEGMQQGQQAPQGGPPPMGEDSMSISGEGMKMAGRMGQMRGMDPSGIEEMATSMEETVTELGLEDMDLEEMSTEDLQSTLTDIESALTEMRPDDAPEMEALDIENMTDEEMIDKIEGFMNHAEEVQTELSNMESMANGEMPPPPPPPPSGSEGISAYSSTDTASLFGVEESEETELIDQLIAALQSDEDEETASAFETAISDYLSNGTVTVS